MEYIADLHLHSHYARATSRDLDLETLHKWARIKGIDVVGTGDFTHPAWYATLKERLVEAGNGFFRLRKEPSDISWAAGRKVYFCLSVEVCCIYHYGGKLRKSHHIIFVPDLGSAALLNKRLAPYGNLAADGRPILKLSARDLLEIVLTVSEYAYLIPAHIWTPWFSILGSRSGYDSVQACFRDLTPYIFALETGLSSDPAMNWQWSRLDRYTMVSNSDAHSPRNIGREANLLSTRLSYKAMFEAFKTRKGFLGTLEFFPEQGKYHLDGHRKCNVCLRPAETLDIGVRCPACERPLTVGVLHRVHLLADREKALQPKSAPDFTHIIPLPEIISQVVGRGVKTKTVDNLYVQAIKTFGNEFDILRKVPLSSIEKKLGILYAKAIEGVRKGNVKRDAGYDGVYGKISVVGISEPKQAKMSSFL